MQQEKIDRDARGKEHNRRQKLFDALANVGKTSIYIVPLVIGALYLMVLIHKAFISHDWSGLETDVRSMLIPVSTYFAGLMSKNGLLQK